MKDRSWLGYALDFTGIITLGGAAIAIVGARWFSASAAEAMLLASFKYCLMLSVSAFLMARIGEISRMMLRPSTREPVALEANAATTSNVESLPQRDGLPRAA